MEETYKEHLIRSDARVSLEGWRAAIRVSWNENAMKKMKLWTGQISFQTKKEAEREAHLLAKKWIDEDKPNLEP